MSSDPSEAATQIPGQLCHERCEVHSAVEGRRVYRTCARTSSVILQFMQSFMILFTCLQTTPSHVSLGFARQTQPGPNLAHCRRPEHLQHSPSPPPKPKPSTPTRNHNPWTHTAVAGSKPAVEDHHQAVSLLAINEVGDFRPAASQGLHLDGVFDPLLLLPTPQAITITQRTARH